MHRTVPRHALIALLAVAAAAGCTSQAEKERLARPPLREVFAPPPLEAPPTAAAPGAAPAGTAGAAPATGAAAVDANAAAFESVPAAAAGGGAALKAPAPSVQAPDEMRAPAAASADSEGAHLKAPSLSEPPAAAAPAAATATAAAAPAPDAPAPAEEAAAPAPDAAPPARAASVGEVDLAKEFESIPAAGAAAAAAQTAAAEPAPVAAAEQAPHAAAPAPAPVPSSTAAAPVPVPSSGAAASTPAVPKVIVTNRPAVLVSIEGQPRFGPMPGSKLQRVLNTPAFLVKGASGNLYLSVYDGFMTAPKLAGPWSVMKTVPRVVQDAKARALQEGEADLLAGRPDADGKRPSLKQPPAPRVVMATQPTALVVTRGDPVYEPVEGTKLSRVANTDSLLYVNRPEDRTYLKVGDHWYRAKSLKGPWSAVEAAALPEGLEDAIPAK